MKNRGKPMTLWPPGAGWSTEGAAGKWEAAVRELSYPLYSTSMTAKRTRLQSRVTPFAAGRDSHLVFSRGAHTDLWVDGIDRMRLLNPPPAPLLWSDHQRLWLGGAPGQSNWPVEIRRVTFFDRALESDEVRVLAAGGPTAPVPDRMAPLLQVDIERHHLER